MKPAIRRKRPKSGTKSRRKPAAKEKSPTLRPIRRGLRAYRAKRKFDRTREPAGAEDTKPRGGPLRFVVQKHAARRLHYDFRLELDGTLKSWAVPKGPSLDPRVRRLAVQVEDHPLEYGSFEGTIPAGQYGAGTVMVWDRGHWVPEGDPRAGLRKGHLEFRLDGKKLRGTWRLIRIGGSERSRPGSKPAWLLIKANDAESRSRNGDALLEDERRSVKTGRDLDEITAGKRGARPTTRPRRTAPPPDKSPRGAVSPELATLVSHAPAGLGWLHEIKLDGYRLMASIDRGRARLISRGGEDWTARLPEVAAALEKLPCRSAFFDGELVALDEQGISDFQLLQSALAGGRTSTLIYQVFDLVRRDGVDLAGQPLIERKAALATLVKRSRPPILLGDHIEGDGSSFFEEACRLGLEGIVSKRKDSLYRPGRHHDWLKTKCGREEELVIGGWSEPRKRRSGFGALLLGVPSGQRGRLRYAGRVGTGFRGEFVRSFAPVLARLETPTCPFAPPPAGAGTRVHWVQPSIIAEVRTSGWTREGKVRQASFRRVKSLTVAGAPKKRRSKSSQRKPDVEPAPESRATPRGRSAPAPSTVAGHSMTHPDRVVFPDRGITKLQLAEYYEAVAERMLPHVAGRPLTLLRCPQGAAAACFLQKHWTGAVPAGLRAVLVPEKAGKARYVVVESAKGLVALVQAGAIELHCWSSTTRKPGKPDLLIFDLDPGPGSTWGDLRDIALLLRQKLQSLELEPYLKTSGGKGLHLYTHIEARLSASDVVRFAKDIASDMVESDPERCVTTASKEARRNKIYVDYLRNASGATCVAPYSARARQGATVSTPLAWSELTPRLDRANLDIAAMLARLESGARDPWTGLLAKVGSLAKARRLML